MTHRKKSRNARSLRQKQTREEARLWRYLRNQRHEGTKFRRQHCLGPYYVDFYCHSASLIIELDGPVHDQQQEYDTHREQWLLSQGFQMLRISNMQLRWEFASAITAIETALSQTPPEEKDAQHKNCTKR